MSTDFVSSAKKTFDTGHSELEKTVAQIESDIDQRLEAIRNAGALAAAGSLLTGPLAGLGFVGGGSTAVGAEVLRRSQGDVTGVKGELVEIMASVDEVFSQVGDPMRLWDVSDSWFRDVEGPISDKTKLFDEQTLDVDRWWKGLAADEYIDLIAPQKNAMTGVHQVANKIGVALSNMAGQIVIYWVQVGSAMATAVIGIGSSAINLANPAGAISAVAGIINALLTGVKDAAKALAEAFVAFKKAVQELEGIAMDKESLPLPWPGPTRQFKTGEWKAGYRS